MVAPSVPKTFRDEQADRKLRQTPQTIVTAQIRADQERDAFERATHLEVDRGTGKLLRHPTKETR